MAFKVSAIFEGLIVPLSLTTYIHRAPEKSTKICQNICKICRTRTIHDTGYRMGIHEKEEMTSLYSACSPVTSVALYRGFF